MLLILIKGRSLYSIFVEQMKCLKILITVCLDVRCVVIGFSLGLYSLFYYSFLLKIICLQGFRKIPDFQNKNVFQNFRTKQDTSAKKFSRWSQKIRIKHCSISWISNWKLTSFVQTFKIKCFICVVVVTLLPIEKHYYGSALGQYIHQMYPWQ